MSILGNIHILGTFYSVTNDDSDDEELVIFITTIIVDNSIKVDNL